MLRTAVPSRRHGELAGIGLGISDELGNRFGRNRWMYYHDFGRASDASDRHDVADEIETEVVVERRVDRIGHSDQEERVAVCRRAHDRFGTNIGARAWSVLDDEWLAQPLGQPSTHQTGDEVVCAAGGDWHDQMYRPRRISLRLHNPRHSRQHSRARSQLQEYAT